MEAAVLIVERWLLGRLRHRIFYSLAEVNAAIGQLLHNLNDKRVLRRVGATRRQLFEELDRPALRPLPVERYVFAEWRIRRAGLDYHVEIERHYYSVPYRFAREQVEARITANTIEIFHKGERIAAHRRSSGNGKHTTIPDHMPSAHRRFADWTIERIQREASAMGPDVALLWSAFLPTGLIPSRAFELASASSASTRASAATGSMPLAAVRWRLAHELMARCDPSSTITLTGRLPQMERRRMNRSITPTSADLAITTKENERCLPIQHWIN